MSVLARARMLTGLLLTSLLFCGCQYDASGIPPTPAQNDPPARVARLSYFSGSVLVRPAGTDEWSPAELNRPFTSGDAIWTRDNARAELHMGSAVLRLASGTSVSLLEVGTSAIQLQLIDGIVVWNVRELDPDEELEIDTPDTAMSVLRPGTYRISVSTLSAGTTAIVRSGQAELRGQGFSFALYPNQQARVPGPQTQSYVISNPVAEDEFEAFCAERTRREDLALSRQHISPRMVGYEDLEYYGEWTTHPTWGPVWSPRGIAPGWAPYRFGHWIWVEPWGWTWIDVDPWGFAPFHYGRWLFLDTRWVWLPGPWNRYPIYAPALVVFIGGGGPGLRFHFQVGGGPGIAWFPLGPHEVWFPPYRASRRYVTNINVSHTEINHVEGIHNIKLERQNYVNRGVSNAVTAVPENIFRGAGPIQNEARPVAVREAAIASIGGSAPPVSPGRDSLAAPGPRISQPGEGRAGRPPVVTRTPPQPPVPFDQRRPALDSAAGRAPAPAQLDQLRNNQPARQPQYRQIPRPQPNPPARQMPQQPAVRPQPKAETRQDRAWDQKTVRDEARRQNQISRESGRQGNTQPSGRGANPRGK